MPKVAKKKAKRQSTVRNRIPTLSNPQIVADTRYGIGFDAVPAMADALVQLWADIAEHRKACRKAFDDGKSLDDLPKFPASKLPNPNAGRLTRKEDEEAVDAYNEAIEAGKTPAPSPARYCVVEQEMIAALGCTVIRKGQLPKEPDNWDEDKKGLWKDSSGKPGGIAPPEGWNERKWGSWFHLDEDGKRTIPSGWLIDSARQRGCHQSIDKLVENRGENVVTVGGYRYIIGSGVGQANAALHQIDVNKRGRYGAIWDVRRRLCTAGVKGVTNLVWRIEDRPNAGSCVKIDMDGKGNLNFFMPGQAATPGYLSNGDGKEMTAAQIRKAIEDETKGVKFKALGKDHIVGEWVSMDDDAYPEIKKAWKKGTNRENAEVDSLVQTRVSHYEGYPFGFRGASVAIVPCYRWVFDGNKCRLEMNLVIGARQNVEHNVSKQEASAVWYEANPEAEEVEAPAPAKPKASKPKPAPAKPKASKPKPDEPAPIVADTSDDVDEDAEADEADAAQREIAQAEVAAASDEE